MCPQRGQENITLDGFGEIGNAANTCGPIPIGRRKVGGKRDDRYVRQVRDRLDLPRRLPPIHSWQREVHEDEIGDLARRALEAMLAVGCLEDLEFSPKESPDDVAILRRVLDVEEA